MYPDKYVPSRNATVVPAGPDIYYDTADGSIRSATVSMSPHVFESFFIVDPLIRNHRVGKEKSRTQYIRREYRSPGGPAYVSHILENQDQTLSNIYLWQKSPEFVPYDFGSHSANKDVHDTVHALYEELPLMCIYESGQGFQVIEKGKNALFMVDDTSPILDNEFLKRFNTMLQQTHLDDDRDTKEISDMIHRDGIYGQADMFIRHIFHEDGFDGYTFCLGASVEAPEWMGDVRVPIVYSVRFLSGLVPQMHGHLAEAYNFNMLNNQTIHSVMQLKIEPSLEDAYSNP